MPLANYTTKVPTEDSIAEIQKMLVAGGAQSISTHYANNKIDAIEFVIKLDGFPLQFRLPQNTAQAHKVLSRQKVKAFHKTPAHAESVCWRILRDWVRAQLAMVELQQADIEQVFMPYAMVEGRTVYSQFRETRKLQLGAGK